MFLLQQLLINYSNLNDTLPGFKMEAKTLILNLLELLTLYLAYYFWKP